MPPPSPPSAALPRPPRVAVALPARWAAYVELTKPRLLSLVIVTTVLGYLLAGGSAADWRRLLATAVGTSLVGGGANALNQWWEVLRDARMRRTQGRPLPTHRVSRRESVVVALLLTGAGLVVLAAGVQGLTASLALASWCLYVFAYTPLKPRTPFNTIVGAVSGAIPPAIGWTAATGRVGAGAWVLFAILFVWQIPHFLSIAWIHRRDYEAGGFRMLPVVDPDGSSTFTIAVAYALGLLPAAWAAAFAGLAGWLYLVGSTLLGLGMVAAALALHRKRTVESARALFFASLAYLPSLFLLMLLDPTRLPR
ncbi:MAG: heme o synthase [bacterium]